MNTFEASKEYARLCLHNNFNGFGRFDVYNFPHYQVFRDLLTFMGSIGFYVCSDKTVDECIRKYHFYGRYKDLEFKADIYPAGFRFQFYQNITFENPHGGYYDFDIYKKMPYLIKLELTKTLNKMHAHLIAQDIAEKKTLRFEDFKYAEDKVKAMYVSSWHKPQMDMDFDIADIHGTTEKESYNICDKEGKTIYNGDVKYFRDYDGALKRGIAYHNINNMWWVILDKFTVKNVCCRDLFDAKKTDFEIRRFVRSRVPEKYLNKCKLIEQMSNKELKRELLRRRCNNVNS